jgi:hypothetical protein
LTLAGTLPRAVSQCTVTYNTREQVDGMLVIEAIRCK